MSDNISPASLDQTPPTSAVIVEPDPTSSTTISCVICLGQVTDRCKAVPCGHVEFDYLCLLTWFEHRATCPLCVTPITTVQHAVDRFFPASSSSSPTLEWVEYAVPEPESPIPCRPRIVAFNELHAIGPRADDDPARTIAPCDTPPQRDRSSYRLYEEQQNAILYRILVYQRNAYSMHMGSNSQSGYREITPQLLRSDERLVEKARTWIERELKVLGYESDVGNFDQEQDPAALSTDHSPLLSPRHTVPIASLAGHIISILKEVDMQSSRGVVVDMLTVFFGQEDARLFLHELRSWMRCPFFTLEEWDQHVQYGPQDQSNEYVLRDAIANMPGFGAAIELG